MQSEENYLTDTRKVVKLGKDGLCVLISKQCREALNIREGSLIEIRIRNTGMFAEKGTRQSRSEGSGTPPTSSSTKETEEIIEQVMNDVEEE